MSELRGGLFSRTVQDFITNLKTSQLVMLVSAIFLADLLIPDAIPFIDEIVLFVITLLVSRWKTRQREAAEEVKPPPRNVTDAGSND